jgi:hypothetical protein
MLNLRGLQMAVPACALEAQASSSFVLGTNYGKFNCKAIKSNDKVNPKTLCKCNLEQVCFRFWVEPLMENIDGYPLLNMCGSVCQLSILGVCWPDEDKGYF